MNLPFGLGRPRRLQLRNGALTLAQGTDDGNGHDRSDGREQQRRPCLTRTHGLLRGGKWTVSHPQQSTLKVGLRLTPKDHDRVGPSVWLVLQVNPCRLEVVGRQHGNERRAVVGLHGKSNLGAQFTNQVMHGALVNIHRAVFGQHHVEDGVVAEVLQRCHFEVKRHHSCSVLC